jgi:hypothetical protein
MIIIYILIFMVLGALSFLWGFYEGLHNSQTQLRIAFLKEENARIKCMNTISRSAQRIEKALKEASRE